MTIKRHIQNSKPHRGAGLNKHLKSIQTPNDIRDQEIWQRNQDEREKRLSLIRNPVDLEKLITALKWMTEKGTYDDLDTLFSARVNPKINQEAMLLISHAIKCISDRDIAARAKNRPEEIERITTPLVDESDIDRKQRAEKIRVYAIEVFENDEVSADKWLRTPRSELNEMTPYDFLVTPRGTEIVEEMLGRIDYGVYH
jgi:putative toxin-antitoxin system antitoxin component (TIGR02293 family)